MLSYAIKRIGLAVLIIFVVMLAMYAMVFLVPGDPASLALGPRATPELKRALMERMGLDQPIYVQVWNFFRNALTGDLGYDVWSKRPVSEMIAEVFPNTLFLGVVAMTIALVAGIGLGCLAVVWQGRAVDRVLAVLSVSMISIPSFVVAIYLLLVFAVWLGWFPAIGAGEPGDWGSQIRAVVLPAAAIAITWVGYLARLVRASMLEVMAANHVRTARAFGLTNHGSCCAMRCGLPSCRSSPSSRWASGRSCRVLSSWKRCSRAPESARSSHPPCRSGTFRWSWARCCS